MARALHSDIPFDWTHAGERKKYEICCYIESDIEIDVRVGTYQAWGNDHFRKQALTFISVWKSNSLNLDKFQERQWDPVWGSCPHRKYESTSDDGWKQEVETDQYYRSFHLYIRSIRITKYLSDTSTSLSVFGRFCESADPTNFSSSRTLSSFLKK